MTHLNDISKIYLDQIAEKKKDDSYLETDMKKRQANNEKARKELAKGPQMKNPHFEETQMEGVRDTDPEKGTAERKARLEKKRGMKLDDHPQYAKEALDPVGKEDKDIDNDGDHDKTDKYLLKRRKAIGKAIATRKEETEIAEIHKQAHMPHEVPDKDLKKLVAKAVKRIDTDVDGDTDQNDKAKGELGEFIPGVGNKRLYSSVRSKVAKESFSNWRQDLSEVMTDETNDKPIKEKKVNNKITVNPKLGEAVEELGGTLLEMVEIDEFDAVVESVYDELIEEGFSDDEVERGIETALTTLEEGYYDSAVAASKAAAAKNRGETPKKSMKDRLKSAAKKAIMGTARAAGKVMKAKAAVQAAPGRAKAKARSIGDRVKAVAKKGYEQGRGPVEKKTTYRNAGAGRKEKIGEATEDSLRDRRMERGGVDGNTRYDKAPKFTSGPKKKYDGMSALDFVKADIRKKHGKDAIIDTKKK